MSCPPTKVVFEHNDGCAETPIRPTVTAWATLTYGDFTIQGVRVVRKGTLVYVMLPKGVSVTSEHGRRRAFDEYVLRAWRDDLHQSAITATRAHSAACVAANDASATDLLALRCLC